MYIEKAMQKKDIEIKLTISSVDGLYNVSINDDESGLAMIGAEDVDALTVGEILRYLYDFSTEETEGDVSPRRYVTPLTEGCGDD